MALDSRAILADALRDARSLVKSIKSEAQDASARLSSNVTRIFVLNLHDGVRVAQDQLIVIQTTPGLLAYARSQFDDVTVDVDAELVNILAAMNSVLSSIETNFPADAGGFLLAEKFVAGVRTSQILTPAQTAALKTEIDALVAAII